MKLLNLKAFWFQIKFIFYFNYLKAKKLRALKAFYENFYLQLFECVKLTLDDMELVFSGKLMTNKPLPVKGSFLVGNLALALFSGGSVRSA